MQLTLILFPIALAIYGAIIYLFVLLVKALRKYIKSKDVREEKKAVCRSLGEALKAHRTEKQMTQEHDIVDWVIGPFTANERKVIDGVLDRALGAAECIITDGVSAAQNRYNG